jgi:hypothetical protein
MKLSRKYQPLKMNELFSLETSGYIKLPAMERNIPEDPILRLQKKSKTSRVGS